MNLGSWYTSFANEFQRWHYRMAPNGRQRVDAHTFLAILQTLNLFALTLWAPAVGVSRWMFVTLFVLCVFVLEALNKRIFDKLHGTAIFPTLADRVPGIKEFPRVYSYLLFTIVMFVAPVVMSEGPSA